MIRRILAGAAIAAAALGFSAAAASADVGPNPQTSGWTVLSQLSTLDDLTALNNFLNDSVKDIQVLPVDVSDINANVLGTTVDSD
ncbi:hypothetical protein [Nonomuraea sp. NPDC049784]|uniref:hypothetical protein n=1 Tax=Nonomuraea sp. NPDC049784 TaxID=3154361 RepID=UPI0033F1BFF7